MTIERAWEIIRECRGWNTSQQSISLAFGGPRTNEDDMLDARREALRKAWLVVGKNSSGADVAELEK